MGGGVFFGGEIRDDYDCIVCFLSGSNAPWVVLHGSGFLKSFQATNSVENVGCQEAFSWMSFDVVSILHT